MGDVSVFREVCKSAELPVAVERSRSGNGAHAWFFFDEPVPAVPARRMGCYLITQAMSKRHDLDMVSYHRLFPNQDTMPRGGFGNLIALPLQHEPRASGNTVFVDASFSPFPDQWAYLARLVRIPASTVGRIASEALRLGQVLGVRSSGADDEEQAAPWRILPSRRARPKARIEESLPKRVDATLAQQLFVRKQGLPAPVLNQIMRLAAFQNPEFYKKQSSQ